MHVDAHARARTYTLRFSGGGGAARARGRICLWQGGFRVEGFGRARQGVLGAARKCQHDETKNKAERERERIFLESILEEGGRKEGARE